MSKYLSHSRSAYYAVVASLPLLLAYELLLAIGGPGAGGLQVRNAPEIWLRTLLESLGISPSKATLVMILVLVLAIPVVRSSAVRLVPRYFGLMFLEALVFGFMLGIVINTILAFMFSIILPATASILSPFPLVQIAEGGLTQGLALSLGAGLFEEFFFRVILLGLLLQVFRLFLPGWLGAVISITLAAFLFSLAHYVGSLGDAFELHGFLFRWLAGLLFTVLFYLRGFAVTAYSHAIYDIWVITGMFRIVGI